MREKPGCDDMVRGLAAGEGVITHPCSSVFRGYFVEGSPKRKQSEKYRRQKAVQKAFKEKGEEGTRTDPNIILWQSGKKGGLKKEGIHLEIIHFEFVEKKRGPKRGEENQKCSAMLDRRRRERGGGKRGM